MSYILEALRKVERQRRAREIPDLATVHGGTVAEHVRSWTPVIVGALVVNAGLLVLLLWYRPWATSPQPPAMEARLPTADVVAKPHAAPEVPASTSAPTGTAPASTAVVTTPPPAVAPPLPPVASAPPPTAMPRGGAPSVAVAPTPSPAVGGSAPGARASVTTPAPAI